MKSGISNILLLATATITLFTFCSKEPVYNPSTGYLLGEFDATLCVGDKIRLSERINPYDSTYMTIVWFTANPDIVTVSKNGDITAVGIGETDIFVVATLSVMIGVCHVTVENCEN